MQTPQEVEKAIIEIVANQMQIDPTEMTRDTAFVADIGMDSLDVVEVTMEFEDQFEVSIPDEQGQSLQTIGQVVDYVVANLATA